MDLLWRADVVSRALDGEVDVFCETNADARVDLGPVPPDARRRILRAVSFEAVVQLAPAHGRLNALQKSFAADRRTSRPVELVPKLSLGSAPVHAGDSLIGELDRRSQAPPLRVYARAGFFLFIAANRKALIERTFEQVEIDA